MVNILNGKRLWQPLTLDWDLLAWEIGYFPNPKGTWYRVPGSLQWIHLDFITSWIHRITGYYWYLIKDTARPLQSSCPPLHHQLDFILAKLTLHWMNHKKGGSVLPHQALLVPAKPVESGCSLCPTLSCPLSFAGAILSTMGGTASCHCKFSRQPWLTSRPQSRSNGRLADANGLVATLVIATYLGRPIQQVRPFPPTLYQRWGGHHRQLLPIPSRRVQTIRILVPPYH